MKKFPLKWKVFLIANLVQIAAFILFFATFIISLVQLSSYNSFTSTMIIREAITVGVILLTILNNSLNIYTLFKFFPDGPFPETNKISFRISWVINVIIEAALLYFYFYIFFNGYEQRNDTLSDIILYGGLLLLWALQLYILVLQFQLSRYLGKKSMSSLIDSIGK